MIHLGLCCAFKEAPIKFRTTTAAAQSRLTKEAQREKLAAIALHNAGALYEALVFCKENGIASFRVNSQVLPLRTHPTLGYAPDDLPGAENIIHAFKQCGELAIKHQLRLVFHPDQFVVISSPHRQVVKSSLAELEHQAEVASWIYADAINIHGGGGYGDKPAALERFKRNAEKLSNGVRERLTLENDDRTYTPSDLYPVCKALAIPLVYDVHHHRCNPDAWSEEEATDRARSTWNRRPLFHVSSPREGWDGPNPRSHHDYIDEKDFPLGWLPHDLTVEVEAKAKERAVLRLRSHLDRL